MNQLEQICECSKKLHFLETDLVVVRAAGHRGNEIALIEHCGLARSTYRDQKRKERLSADTQACLANGCRFSLAWPEWSTGTAEAFKERYRKEHPELTVSSLRKYDPNVLLTSGRIEPLDQSTEPLNLASIELALNQSPPGQPWPVSFTLICATEEPVGSPTFEIAVKSGRIELNPGRAGIAARLSPGEQNACLAQNGPERFFRGTGNEKRQITITSATPTRPGNRAWDVRCEDVPIGMFVLDDEKPLCQIAEPTVGDKVEITFSVWVRDLDIHERDDDHDVDDPESLRSFLRPNGKPLSQKKRAVIKALFVEHELKPSRAGWLRIAADGRAFDTEE